MDITEAALASGDRPVPVASVVISTYNGSQHIAETLESILAQVLREIEIIIVDDASDDDTVSIIESFSDSRLRLVRNKENLGVAATRNRGVALATGEFVAMSDQDDLSLSERLTKQVEFLEANPSVALAATGGKELRDGKLQSRYAGELRAHIVHWRMFSRGGIVHSSVCFRRSVYQVGQIQYNADLRYADDFDVFHQFAELGHVVVMPEELLIYREHDRANSRRFTRTMISNGQRCLLQRYRDYLGLDVSPEQIRSLWRIFCEKIPCESKQELIEVGRTYTRALDAFIARTKFDDSAVEEIRIWALQDWWRIVASHVRIHRSYGWAEVRDAIHFGVNYRPGIRVWLRVLMGR